MEQIYVQLIPTIVLFILSLLSGAIAMLKGKKSKKDTSSLTVNQQYDDLRTFMVSECSRIERFSKFLKNSMTKAELSEYKKTEVLKNISLYAKANGYTWYNQAEWEANLTDYITNANIASGKTTT